MPAVRDPASFRDPDGSVYLVGERVIRAFLPEGARKWAILKASGLLEDLLQRGLVLAYEEKALKDIPELQEEAPGVCAIVEHPRLPFLSYCYEWPFSMLKDAGVCTLEVAERALERGFILKDATPYNIQFLGARPVLIDLASLEPYREGEPWRAYHQFCCLFLNPLLLEATTGVPFQPWLRGALGGLRPTDLAPLLPWRWRMRPFVFTHVVAQAWLERHFASDVAQEGHRPLPRVEREQVLRLLRSLRRGLERLRPRKPAGLWARYQEECHYHPEAQRAKEAFVEGALQSLRPRVVWDLGCNIGHYSLLAARYADLVVGMDSDIQAVDLFYQRVREKARNVLPLVMDLLDPSPNRGWAEEERRGLAQRGPADLVLCLALVHHLAIQGNLPFGHLVRWLARVGRAVVVEFVPKEDPRAHNLLRWREDVFPWYTQGAFETALEECFTIRERFALPHSGRVLYTAIRRGL
ncbi:hypothetical protein HRbin23_00576 [bacterium HR23]|nr:hypothetical protein HRbin23_00576 [bacterium HR23]